MEAFSWPTISETAADRPFICWRWRPACYGFCHCFCRFGLRKSILMVHGRCSRIFRRDLDGSFPAGLYVFQSLVVAVLYRRLPWRCSVVLGKNQIASNGQGDGPFWF